MNEKYNIGNVVDLNQLLEFNVAFPDEKPLTPEEYLKGGSRNIILNVAAYFLGFKFYNSKYKDNSKLLESILGPDNKRFSNEIYNRIKLIEKLGKTVEIINVYSSLKLFEYFFSKEEELETQSHAEFERNLFKAYLLFNSEFTKRQEVAISSTTELEDDIRFPMLMFCMQYPISDKTNYDITGIWITQFVKAIYLFQYLETNENTIPLLKAFLLHFNSPTWKDYLLRLLPLTISAIQNDRESHTDIVVPHDDKFDVNCAFIEKLIVKHNDKLEENDFITTRAKPFYKTAEGIYRIIFNLFVVEKIFKGVYFLLRDINDTLPKELKISDLKGIYCHEFSEQTLLYKIMDLIYPDKCIKFTGKQLKDMHIEGEPDYYLKKGKNVLLFESKDFLIRADKKASFDFSIYEEDFRKTLYYEELKNGKEKSGAVLQLIRNIRRILKNELIANTDYYYKDIFIYPILITHDHQYDTPGFNNLVNYWFQDELNNLEEDEGLFIHHVKPIIVINIDSLIYHQVGLADYISLVDVLDAYLEYIKINKGIKFKSQEDLNGYVMSKLIPFSLYIDKYFGLREIKKLPPILNTIESELFKMS